MILRVNKKKMTQIIISCWAKADILERGNLQNMEQLRIEFK